MTATSRPLSILVCALGGEGGGVLAEWLVATATRCGYAAQSTSIPGVAQRTGATTYYIEIARVPSNAPGFAMPAFSLYAVPGALDLLIASEPLEAARQVAAGFVTPDRTRVIASSERTLTTFEKMQPADGRADDEQVLALLRDYSQSLDVVDMTHMARSERTVLSAIMFGVLAGSGALTFPREAFELTIRDFGKGVSASLAGFDRAYSASSSGKRSKDREIGTPEPRDVGSMVALGRARLVEYQDERYAALYAQRVARVLAAEQNADASGAQSGTATRETARFLASWMAFDDVARVAQLKSRATRFARIRKEVGAAGDEVLRVYDHFKPGIPELAGLLPGFLADRMKRGDRARVARGREPLAWPIKLPVHSLLGLSVLRAMAALKRMRRFGARFADEQAMIERWLKAIEQGFAQAWSVGNEIALCGRLVKGYGATNERGKEILLHILDNVAASALIRTAEARAGAIRAAREAAVADDAGRALDATLASIGAAPRPVKAMPIRFVRRPAQPPRKVA